MKISRKPISVGSDISPVQPHDEIVMVAENSVPFIPNTSVTIINTASNRRIIQLTKNAKIIFD